MYVAAIRNLSQLSASVDPFDPDHRIWLRLLWDYLPLVGQRVIYPIVSVILRPLDVIFRLFGLNFISLPFDLISDFFSDFVSDPTSSKDFFHIYPIPISQQSHFLR